MAHGSIRPFIDVSTGLLAGGYRIRFRAAGGSMRPAICDGDLITVVPVGRARLVPGSVLVYRRQDRLFAHRLVGIEPGPAGGAVFVCRGDAADDYDAPVAAAQVLGEVVTVQRSARSSARDWLAPARACAGAAAVRWIKALAAAPGRFAAAWPALADESRAS
jgi:hypothetical protein